MTDLPQLLRDWKTPWSVTTDGIKDANGGWIMTGSTRRISHQIVELANFAGAMIAAPASAAEPVDARETHRRSFLAGWMRYDTSANCDIGRANAEFEAWWQPAIVSITDEDD